MAPVTHAKIKSPMIHMSVAGRIGNHIPARAATIDRAAQRPGAVLLGNIALPRIGLPRRHRLTHLLGLIGLVVLRHGSAGQHHQQGGGEKS